MAHLCIGEAHAHQQRQAVIRDLQALPLLLGILQGGRLPVSRQGSCGDLIHITIMEGTHHLQAVVRGLVVTGIVGLHAFQELQAH